MMEVWKGKNGEGGGIVNSVVRFLESIDKEVQDALFDDENNRDENENDEVNLSSLFWNEEGKNSSSSSSNNVVESKMIVAISPRKIEEKRVETNCDAISQPNAPPDLVIPTSEEKVSPSLSSKIVTTQEEDLTPEGEKIRTESEESTTWVVLSSDGKSYREEIIPHSTDANGSKTMSPVKIFSLVSGFMFSAITDAVTEASGSPSKDDENLDNEDDEFEILGTDARPKPIGTQ